MSALPASIERGAPDTAPPPAAATTRRKLQRDVERWFTSEGVPHFGWHPDTGFMEFAVPLLAVVLTFEVIAIPWLELDHLTRRVQAVGVSGGPRDIVPAAVALTLVMVAFLIALVPVVPLLRGELPGVGSYGRWRLVQRVSRLISAALTIGMRVAPLVIVLLWLRRERAFVHLHEGDCVDVAAFLLLILAAWRFARQPATDAEARRVGSWVGGLTAFSVLWTWWWPDIEPGSDLRQSLVALPVVLWLLARAPAPRRPGGTAADREADAALRVPVFLVVLAFELAVMPYLWSTETAVNGALSVAALIVPLAALRLAGGRGWFSTLTPRLALAVVALFVVVPAGLAFGVSDRLSDATPVATAATMLAMNVAVLVAITAAVAFGLHHVYEWIAQEPFRAATLRSRAVERAGPIVVVFIFFFFFTTELWNLAANLDRWRFWILVLTPLAFAAWIVSRSALQVIHDQGAFESYEHARTSAHRVENDAVRELATIEVDDPRHDIPLDRAEQVNIMAILITKALLRIVVVSVGVAVGLFVVGLLAVNGDVLHSWQVGGHGSPTSLALRVAAFLGAFSALYFVVEGSRDQAMRTASFQDVDDSIRRRLAVRIAFRNVFPRRGVTPGPPAR